MSQKFDPSKLECTIDEGRHKTNGKQTEGMICPQGYLSGVKLRSTVYEVNLFHRGTDQGKSTKNP